MHRLEQDREHLLRVMLRETLELNGLSSDPVLDIPRRGVLLPSCPKVREQLREGHCEAAPGAQCVSLVHVAEVDLEEEELHQRFCIGQTLKHGVHEACVAKVLESCETTSHFGIVHIIEQS